MLTVADKRAIVYAYRVAIEAKADGCFTADDLDLLIDEALEDSYDGLDDDPFDGLGPETWARIDLRRNPPPMPRWARILLWVGVVGAVLMVAAMVTLWAIHWNDPRPVPKEVESMKIIEVYEGK